MTAHKPGHRTGVPPTVSPIILAHVTAHPGTTTKSLYAALGGSRISQYALLARHVAAGRLWSAGEHKIRAYYATLELAEHARSLLVAKRPRGAPLPPIQPAVRRVLVASPQGVAMEQLRAETGFAHIPCINALHRMKTSGQAFHLRRGMWLVYFASQADRDAARAGYFAVWDALDAEKAAAARVVHNTWALLRYHERAAKQGRISGPRKPAKVKPAKAARAEKAAPRVVKVASLKPERAPAVPKPKTAAALVFAKMPISNRPKVSTRAGWGRDDPVHITADTIITIYKAPTVQHYRTNTHFQY